MKKIVFMLLLSLGLFYVQELQALETDDPFEIPASVSTTLIDSNLFTRVEDLTIYDQPTVDLTNFVEVLDNDRFTMYVNPNGLALRVLNKDTGYYWASDVVNISDYELTGAWIRRINSAITIDFLNESNITVTSSMIQRRSNESADSSYEVNGDEILFHVDFAIEMIRLDYTVKLTEEGFEIKVLRETIEEYGPNRLLKLYLYEFFGTVNSDDIPGYFFIPSGNGALVRFTPSSAISNVYRARFYGSDKYRVGSSPETLLNYPVFGVVHGVNQNGMLVEVKEGAEYAEYLYTPPTYQTTFHSQNALFLMRENHVQPLSATENITIYESEIKDYNPTLSFTILEGDDANYIGFAKTYKENLVERGILDESYAPDGVGMHVDVLMKEYEKGLLFKKNFVMTSFGDLKEINRDLVERGVTNIHYTLRGYNRGGYSDRSYDNYKLDRSIGSPDDVTDLDVSYYYDPTIKLSYRKSMPSESLKMVNRRQYSISRSRGEYFEYLVDLNVIEDHFSQAYETLNNRGGIALDGISNELNSNETMTRTEVMGVYNDMFTERMPMYRPDYYNLSHASKVYMNLIYHNRSRFFTDSVPFEQILLSGYMELYSQFLNFSPNIHVDVLKVIEYGINPAFLITYRPSHLLSRSISKDLYATYYGNLDTYMVETYEKVNEALQDVMGHEIIWREVISSGVVRVDYDNGMSIYVNYTNQIVTTEGIIINPLDAVVKG